ncbi:HNH endonuclease [Vibrio sp. DNB22_19_1]
MDIIKRFRDGYGKHTKEVKIANVEGQLVALISLGKRKVAMIDLCDIELLSERSFYAQKRNDGNWVARCSQDGQLLHRLIERPEWQGQEVDHVNKDTLNNRRGNLRLCSSRQNNLAKDDQPSYKCWFGVKRVRDYFRAWDAEEKKWVGKFSTAKRAAQHRDESYHAEYFHSWLEEPHHPYGFIQWNFSAPQKALDMDDYLFDKTIDAVTDSYEKGEELGLSW